MKPTEAIIMIKNISFLDLRRHKLKIIELIPKVPVETGEALEGILSLIDAVQDNAVDNGNRDNNTKPGSAQE